MSERQQVFTILGVAIIILAIIVVCFGCGVAHKPIKPPKPTWIEEGSNGHYACPAGYEVHGSGWSTTEQGAPILKDARCEAK